MTYDFDYYLEDFSHLTQAYGCQTGCAVVKRINVSDEIRICSSGCIYVLTIPDPDDPDGIFCFKENGDHPTECLKGI